VPGRGLARLLYKFPLDYPRSGAAVAPWPAAYAKLPVPVEWAFVTSVAPLVMPLAMAPSNVPLAVAVVLGPIPIAKLVAVLVQVEPPELPALTPLMDAQVAFAAPAPLSDAMASAPEAAAPSSSPLATRSVHCALC
jgi:hypothetical protein